jgi:hypothetical protein
MVCSIDWLMPGLLQLLADLLRMLGCVTFMVGTLCIYNPPSA